MSLLRLNAVQHSKNLARAAAPKRAFGGHNHDSTCGSNAGPVLDDKHIERIFGQNEEWQNSMTKEDPDYFKRTGSTHQPKYLWIGCADARVPANEIMGEGPGTVFVHRNVGNQVVSADVSIMATLQYAVDYLKVPHIVVCGHYDCGAVKAANSMFNHEPPLENWLTGIRDVKRLHRDELNALPEGEARVRRLVELNVVESCLNLFKTGTVQRRRVETYNDPAVAFTLPRIHALVFDPSVGKLERLPVDFDSILEEYSGIYDIHGKNTLLDAVKNKNKDK